MKNSNSFKAVAYHQSIGCIKNLVTLKILNPSFIFSMILCVGLHVIGFMMNVIQCFFGQSSLIRGDAELQYINLLAIENAFYLRSHNMVSHFCSQIGEIQIGCNFVENFLISYWPLKYLSLNIWEMFLRDIIVLKPEYVYGYYEFIFIGFRG